METTRLKYNLVFINLTWLLGVQMDNIIWADPTLSEILKKNPNPASLPQILYITRESNVVMRMECTKT